jgi:excinuclease ABC subunit C
MRQQMSEAADKLEFERAQRIKEHIKILESTLESQVVERNTDHNQDIIFLGDDQALVAEVRHGMIQGMHLVELDEGGIAGDSFLLAHYQCSSPAEIITNRCANPEWISQALSLSNGYPVNILLPQSGLAESLLKLCEVNYQYRTSA